MKKILSALIGVALLSSRAFAGPCETSLMPAFTAGQATNLCKSLSSAIVVSQVPATNNSLDLGSASKQWRNIYAGTGLILGTTGGAITMTETTPASACRGVATPNGNTNVAVTTSCAVSGSRVFYTRVGAVTNMASISTTVAPSGTGFSFASTGATDTLASSVVWLIIK